MTEAVHFESLYRTYRSYALSIAYRMLGLYTDAEDIVQDLFAELALKDTAEIRNMKSYIAKSVTNRCLNLLHSAQKKREEYIGQWLPEPVAGAAGLPELAAEQKDTLSYAYLLMLERLTPTERAVFLLREVFEYDYGQIADITDKTEANCRKIYSRAKKQLQGSELPASPVSNERQKAVITRFADAFLHYDPNTLLELLAEDAVFISDGGGVVRTAIRPISGRERIIRLLTSPKAYRDMRSWKIQMSELNGEISLLFIDGTEVKSIFCFRMTDAGDRLQDIYNLKNPLKLEHLQPIIF
ncbi:sigma-70 family RNA polymerase sigma factor [Paenibacillus donghaensis]|uniref:sigma-70 family RNA polymerase sigma factor n=1 Tax=Paenibacillus donghaensis TaxID=414771 RepID=UPI0018848DE6|nr:sigma-70 family RNA polymerase sigma factor [Paenibacillus donghaensis]MBE9916723.1 sigma-70 family RNA polymerase sigma factor [Paenibacillus donghaensis]